VGLALESRRLEKRRSFCVFGSFVFEVAPPVFFWVCRLEVPAEETRNLDLFFTWVWELRLLLCAAFITKLDIIRGGRIRCKNQLLWIFRNRT
jgi:hypothetical protein